MAVGNVIALITLVILAASKCNAYSSFQNQIPNGASVQSPCDPSDHWQGVGHWAQGGAGPRNPFGLDFKAAQFKWTNELCQKDSDGDGKSNGQELGDPSCVWAPGNTPSRTSGITHPGICEPPDSDSCKDKNGDFKCPEKWDCPSIHEPGVVVKDLKFDKTQVPPKETTYICQAFHVSSKPLEHVIATYPIVDNSQVLHHMIIYGCSQKPTDNMFSPFECEMGIPNCVNLMDLWGYGQPPGNCYPKEAGAPFGTEGYQFVVIQLHWNNPTEANHFVDGSGFTLYMSPTLREHSTGVMMYGQTRLELPSGAEEIQRNGTCPSICSESLLKPPGYKILWGTLHMHLLGKRGKVSLHRDGKSSDLIPMHEYDYNTPVIKKFDPPIDYRPGDAIYTECHFATQTTKRMVFYGEGTQDEMCFSFFQYYPHDLTTKNKYPHIDFCSQWDKVDYCSGSLPDDKPYVVDGCNIKDMFRANLLKRYIDEAHEKCRNTYGLVCLDECLAFMKQTILLDPCFQGIPLDLLQRMVNQRFWRHYEELMLYINTCKLRIATEKLNERSETGSRNGIETALLASVASVAAVAIICITIVIGLLVVKRSKVKPTADTVVT